MKSAKRKRRVVKVGGSLLPFAELPQRLRNFLGDPEWASTVVVGCGGFADHLRELADQHDFSESFCHQFCLDLMSLTSRMVADWIGIEPTTQIELVQSAVQKTHVFDVSGWLRDRPGVPESWHLSSDSIAAIVARELKVDELVMLKSRPAENGLSADAPPLVDSLFDQFAADLNVRFVHFRSAELLKE